MSEAIITNDLVRIKIKSWLINLVELKEFLPLLFLKFFVCFNYTVLNAMKDTVVVTAKGSGAEVIPVLKGGVVLLFAFLVMLAYAKLSNLMSQKTLFYTILAGFAGFFFVYGFLLFPNKDLLSPHKSADWLTQIVGINHKHWVAVYRNWIDSLFFIAVELWGGMMIGLLFWGLANQITSMKNAAKFYIFYTAGGQLGTLIAGFITYYYSVCQGQQFSNIIAKLMLVVLFICLFMAVLYWITEHYIVTNQVTDNNSNLKASKAVTSGINTATKLNLKQSLLFIFRSKHLGLIAIMVIGYSISINMVEVCWKGILKIKFPSPSDYQAYMGLVQANLGVVSFIVALFIGRKIIKNYGWYFSAQLTPIVLAVTSGLFFAGYFLFPNYAQQLALIKFSIIPSKCTFLKLFTQSELINISITPLDLLVFFGTIHGICCKTMKYCLFDTTKEMAYIPLDQESKIKGKAAVDLVGSRFGKSGGSWAQLALIDLIGAGSILEVMHFLCPCIVFILIFWLMAVKGLNQKLNQLAANPVTEAI